jgi:very-short-patch-repair endonuclease
MPSNLTPIARKLRRNATSAERRLWAHIRREQVGGFKFRRQVSLSGFVVDFACYDARLVIEVDGATHSTDAEVARDTDRDLCLGAQDMRSCGSRTTRCSTISTASWRLFG